MSLFSRECLKCGKLDGYWFGNEDTVLKCSKCGAEHEVIGEIKNLHICHSIPIWRLKGTKKTSAGMMPVMTTTEPSNPDVIFFKRPRRYKKR